MLRRLAFGLAAVLVAACGASAPAGSPVPSTPVAASTVPTPAPSLQVSCGAGLSEADCGPMRDAALAVVSSSGHRPVHVWLSSGVQCQVPELLFDPMANCPAPTIPKPGATDGALLTASASAEIAFADTSEHAGVNIFPTIPRLTTQLIGYRMPDRAWCSGECAGATDQTGAFTLELGMPHLDWKAGEPIVGSSASLSVQAGTSVTVSGAPDIIVFGYAEVGGKRAFGPASDLVCAPTTIDPATALNVPLGKSGGYDPNNPDDAWIVPFLNADGVRLPAGNWDVTAEAQFTEGTACSATPRDLRATLRVVVGP